MVSKPYKTPKSKLLTVNEPATAYQRRPATAEITSSKQWNPNVPFHATQEEWWEHFHQIEEGNFTPLEEANSEFNLWKKAYLASKLK